MARALYRKYRSKSLDEIVGQSHVTDILSRALKQGKVAHAYLLTGPRGVGKTSIARILAHEINGLEYTDDSSHLDIIEIDAASNNGVEDIRDLREKSRVAPTSAAKKVYIIDEVHMLSKAAFNALLKTLEEPPEHVVFILATTDSDKLPATIVSRTQRFGFRTIARNDAVTHLRFIADSEGIKIDDTALELIALHGDGSFRDSISLLDQVSSLVDESETISAQHIEASLGLAPTTLVTSVLKAVKEHDQKSIVSLLKTSEEEGIQASVLLAQLIHAAREQLSAGDAHAVELLDALVDVKSSHSPSLKLLTTLLKLASPKSTNVALVATPEPIGEVHASLQDLAAQSTVEKPSLPPVKPAQAPTQQKAATATVKKVPTKTTLDEAVVSKPKLPVNVDDFDWQSLVDYTKANHVALYSVLSKCVPEQDGAQLTLYTQNNFYKKKLDDSKYLPMLYTSLETLGVIGMDITTIPTPPPPKDSQAAAVAAIMGGGEEVAVE